MISRESVYDFVRSDAISYDSERFCTISRESRTINVVRFRATSYDSEQFRATLGDPESSDPDAYASLNRMTLMRMRA